MKALGSLPGMSGATVSAYWDQDPSANMIRYDYESELGDTGNCKAGRGYRPALRGE